MSNGIIDVSDAAYGAKGDGLTDDGPAFQKAMDAMGPVASATTRHGTLLVPSGDYFFAADLKIERAIKLVGVGPGSGSSKTRLVFAPYKGIRLYTNENSPRGGDASYATIEDVDVMCGHLQEPLSAPTHPVWQPGKLYVVGDAVLPAVDRRTRPGSTWEYYYECISAGTSAGVEPDWTQVQGIDQSQVWQSATDYYHSSVITAPNRFDVYFTPRTPHHDATFPESPRIPGDAIKSGDVVPPQFATAVPGYIVTETNSAGQAIIWHCYSTGDVPPLWQPRRNYLAGQIVRSAVRGDALFLLQTSGTTGDVEPPAFLGAVASLDPANPNPVPEGALTWGCYLDSSIWLPATDYAKGAMVRPVNRYDVSFTLETIEGASPLSAKSSNAEPFPPTARPGDLVLESGGDGQTLHWRCHSGGGYVVGDGRSLAPGNHPDSPIWACRVAAGIYSQGRVTVNRVAIQGALNAGLHVQASGHFLPASNANGFAVYDLKVFTCGCGIVTRGDDCNASTVIHADIELFDESDKEVGIAERGFLGNHYYSCQIGACKGPAFLVTSLVNSGGLYGCYSEAGTGPIQIDGSSFIVFGGDYGSGFAKESRAWVLQNRFSIPPFSVANEASGSRIETYLGIDDDTQSALGWGSFDIPGDVGHAGRADNSYWLIRWYGARDQRYWSTEYGGGAVLAAYLTGDKYKRGPALQGFPSILLGDPGPGVPVRLSTTADAAVPPDLADAEPGDIKFNTAPTAGGTVGWVCVGQGAAKQWKRFGSIEA